jgi:lipopolysaccharide/colanic/teichoic acid biosynthesis glycosyltransferase
MTRRKTKGLEFSMIHINFYPFIKRLFDLIFSFMGLLVLWPFFLLIAFLIHLDSKGPAFYRGTRVGKDGNLFNMLKFRTMFLNADKLGPASTSNDDPRITRVGHFLRKYKIDEWPQLINVLKGEMSFVGPRPEVRKFVDLFTDEEKKILNVPPGITDWASLWNTDEGAVLAGSQDPDKDYFEKIRPEKIRLQLKYINERSLRNDLSIIWRTLMKIFLREGR